MTQDIRILNDKWVEAAKTIHSLKSFRAANQTVGYNLVKRIPYLLTIIDQRDATIKGLEIASISQYEAIQSIREELDTLKAAFTRQSEE